MDPVYRFFINQRSRAKQRGISWDLPYWEWLQIWQESGRLEERGRDCWDRPIFMPDPYVDDAVRVEIGPRFIKEMEAAIALLKMCDKFWTCVAERDGYVEPKGKKPKHCYLPKN
jgi:hypothetical protein